MFDRRTFIDGVFLALLDLISCYGAGLTKMSVRSYVIANFFGMLPLTFVYNYFGALVKVNFAVSLVLGLLFMALFFLIY